jgi:hypothetical protein
VTSERVSEQLRFILIVSLKIKLFFTKIYMTAKVVIYKKQGKTHQRYEIDIKIPDITITVPLTSCLTGLD